MKKLILAAIACLGLTFTGCKPGEEWTPEKSYTVGLRIGATAGAVVDAQKYDTKITDKSLEVVDLVVGLVPGEGQTFKELWIPKIEEFLDKQEGMSAITKLGVNLIAGILVSALDKEVEKHPEILSKKEIAAQLVKGVADGYKTYVKPSNNGKHVSAGKPALIVDIDRVLYKEMELQLKRK